MTLKEVAKIAGVSHTTVSLVINNAEGSRVSQRTRNRVLKAISKLDFNPNLTAKRLASGKTNSIGLYIPFVLPIFRNYTIVEMVTGIQDIVYEKGFDLVLFSGSKNLYRDRPLTQIVKQNTVDGLIIFNTRDTKQHFINRYIRELNELKFNYVILQYYWGNENIKYVGVDYEKDALKATSYLISLGHKNIALLTGLPHAPVTSKIINGYKRALQNSSIKIRDKLIVNADYDYQMAYEKTRMILNNHLSVTSFFTAGYEMAPGCLKAIKDLGLNVPRDISIVAYIDNEIMALMDPPLTAIKIPYYDLGKTAAELLLEKDPKKKRIIFETELVLRDSTTRMRKR